MGAEIEIGTVGHALELTPIGALEAEAVFDVDGALRIVCELFLRMLVMAQILGVHTEVDVPLCAGVDPVLMPVLIGARLNEELHLHLLELAGTEDEVAWRDLVAEALAGVGDAERRLGARRGHHVLEVHEDALCRLRSQIMEAVLIFHRTEVRTQHHVEVTGFGPIAAGAAVRAHDVLEAIRGQLVVVLLGIRLLELVGAMTLVAGEAFDKWIVEHRHVAGGDPHLGRQDDRRVDAHDIWSGDDHRAPPFALDVVFERHAERPVVPRRAGATVDLAGREHEAATLGEGDNFIDFGISHNAPSGLNGLGSYTRLHPTVGG